MGKVINLNEEKQWLTVIVLEDGGKHPEQRKCSLQLNEEGDKVYFTARLFKTKFRLIDMQDAVGGYIELIQLIPHIKEAGFEEMYMNETGRFEVGFGQNSAAMNMSVIGEFTHLVGHAVLVRK